MDLVYSARIRAGDREAIEALAADIAEHGPVKAARIRGLSRSTLFRWMRTDALKRAIIRARDAI